MKRYPITSDTTNLSFHRIQFKDFNQDSITKREKAIQQQLTHFSPKIFLFVFRMLMANGLINLKEDLFTNLTFEFGVNSGSGKLIRVRAAFVEQIQTMQGR